MALDLWLERKAQVLQSLGQPDEVLSLRRQVTNDFPHHLDGHLSYARTLIDQEGELDQALDHLRTAIAFPQWKPDQRDSLRKTYLDPPGAIWARRGRSRVCARVGCRSRFRSATV